MWLRHITSSSLFFFFHLNLNTQKIICSMFRVSELATEFIVPGCKTKTNFDSVKELNTRQETCQIRAEFFQVCHS